MKFMSESYLYNSFFVFFFSQQMAWAFFTEFLLDDVGGSVDENYYFYLSFFLCVCVKISDWVIYFTTWVTQSDRAY